MTEAEADAWYVLDSNILLRLGIQRHADFRQIRSAIDELEARNALLAYTLQNMTEFWNAATRPVDRNGFGLTIQEADTIAQEFERTFTLLPDTEHVYYQWRSLVRAHEVKGVKVYDARLVALMRVYGIRHILSLNDADFRRYPDIVPVNPAELTQQADKTVKSDEESQSG
jgi:predicted nucleic acid-binding protein